MIDTDAQAQVMHCRAEIAQMCLKEANPRPVASPSEGNLLQAIQGKTVPNKNSLTLRAFAAALALTTGLGLPSQVVGATAIETGSCSIWYFGSLGSKCVRYDATTPGVGYTGAIGPQAPNCPTIPVGAVTTTVTPPAGESRCFQWVVSGSVSMPVEVALPANVTGIVELFVIIPNTAGFKLAEARTGTPLSMNYSVTDKRIGLVFRPFTGSGGQNINIGVGVPAAAAPSTLNDTVGTATTVQIHQRISSAISMPGSSQGFYFYPLQDGQTSANYNFGFTSNQTVGIRPAQLLAPNTYALGTESIVPVSKSGQTTLQSSPNPANSAGTATPYGFVVRVTGSNVSAPVDEPYSLRLTSAGNNFYATSTINTEDISRYYPISGRIQVATYLTVTAKIKDASGSFVPNEPVRFEFTPYTGAPSVKQVTDGTTDQYGFLTTTATFPICVGPVLSANNYGPFGTPTDHWKGTAQSGQVKVTLMGSTMPSGQLVTTTIPFTRICSETYLGRY